MITKAQVNHIRLLEDKKYRAQTGQFVVEGDKMVTELLSSPMAVLHVYAMAPWIQKNEVLLNNCPSTIVGEQELKRISFQKNPNQVLALAVLPKTTTKLSSLCFLLDGVQDPGNTGSIIRIADWYKVPAVYTTLEGADPFHPKVVQASMGSIFRVQCLCVQPDEILKKLPSVASYACVLDGKDVHTFGKIQEGIVILGNESKGIQSSLIKQSTYRISIPRKGHAESLNAAVAAGIISDVLL